MKNRMPKPTDAELSILKALWRRGPSTVRQLANDENEKPAKGYTTWLKLLQIMCEKGLVFRDESERAHVYTAYYDEEITQRQLLSDLAAKAFGGSRRKLVLQALSSGPATDEELKEIQEILDAMKGEGND